MRISPSVWVEVGRLSRDAFAAIQEALEAQAATFGTKAELPRFGEIRAAEHVAEFEIDREHRVLTLVGVREQR